MKDSHAFPLVAEQSRRSGRELLDSHLDPPESLAE
jgi:hypothetical protein